MTIINNLVDPKEVNKYMAVKGFNLLILPDAVDGRSEDGVRMTEGGIALSNYDNARELEDARVETGIVVSIGPMAWKGIKGYDYDTLGDWCKVGDHIIYSKYSGKFLFDPIVDDPATHVGVKYAIIPDEMVQVVLDDDYITKAKEDK